MAAIGLVLTAFGLNRLVTHVERVVDADGRRPLLASLQRDRPGPARIRVVAIGGGHGLASALRGLKVYCDSVTAIVTVADDGGSSGRLRRDLGVVPPGDIRNCLAALADEEELLTTLFEYRFADGELAGHSFGNLFLTAMADIAGDFEEGVRAASKVLAVRGQVLPVSLDAITLVAHMADGQEIIGESAITAAGGQIVQLRLEPDAPLPLPDALQAIMAADVILIGPGSLYTSILPNLLVPGITAAIRHSKAAKLFVCNVMTQPGETSHYTASDHLAALSRHLGSTLVDAILVNDHPPTVLRAQYEANGSVPVVIDADALAAMHVQVVLGGLLWEGDRVRHDSDKLARAILGWVEGRLNLKLLPRRWGSGPLSQTAPADLRPSR
ncbi:MAG: YvcK family protein [Candidatus Sericytochromatia bacterium]|nr:YvcK family protein [Candidatus Sericytochromatia bacterium]